MPATGVHVRAFANCCGDLALRDRAERTTRVTIAAAAMESSSAGTCATSASPIARMMYVCADCARLEPVAYHAEDQPAHEY